MYWMATYWAAEIITSKAELLGSRCARCLGLGSSAPSAALGL